MPVSINCACKLNLLRNSSFMWGDLLAPSSAVFFLRAFPAVAHKQYRERTFYWKSLLTSTSEGRFLNFTALLFSQLNRNYFQYELCILILTWYQEFLFSLSWWFCTCVENDWWFSNWLSKYLLNGYYVPGTVLSPRHFQLQCQRETHGQINKIISVGDQCWEEK